MHEKAGTRKLVRESWHEKAGTRKLAQESWYEKAGMRKLSQESWYEKAGTRKHFRVFVACVLWLSCAGGLALLVGSVGKSNGDQFRFSSRSQCTALPRAPRALQCPVPSVLHCPAPSAATGSCCLCAPPTLHCLPSISLLRYIAGVAWTEVLMEFLSASEAQGSDSAVRIY